MDETWCLYDGMLVDDELVNLFGFFNKKVRVLMVSDSCHSGTLNRDFVARSPGTSRRARSTRVASRSAGRSSSTSSAPRPGPRGASRGPA